MKMRRVLSAFLAALFIFCTMPISALAVETDSSPLSVYATTAASVAQGSYEYAYVYINDMTDLASLTVAVHYDTDKITVTDSYNKVDCALYDSSIDNGRVQFSYLFNGDGSQTKTNLFYFRYKVNDTADIGKAVFDIVVSDAYNTSAEPVALGGTRCSFNITEKKTAKSINVYSTSSINTSVKNEFTLSYQFSTYKVASGSCALRYDPELFEVVEVTNGKYLEGKAVDINTDLAGAVYLAFAGTAYNYNYDIITVKFRTLKNTAEISDIKFTVNELYDLQLNSITSNGYTTKANIAFDSSYTEDKPSVIASAAYDASANKLTVKLKLEKNAMLGAGDFVLNFDPSVLSLDSAEQGISAQFFNINDKHAEKGILKFSVISYTDIKEECLLLTAVFSVNNACKDIDAVLDVSGSGLSDSKTVPIILNFADANVKIPAKHTPAEAKIENQTAPTCAAAGSYESVVYCAKCNAEISRQKITVDKLEHNYNENGGCDGCGTMRLGFSGASLSLQHNLTINFAVKASDADAAGFDSIYAIFNMNGVETVVDTYTASGSYYMFKFKNIAPHKLGDTVEVQLHGTVNGKEYSSAVTEYSILNYCNNMLKNYNGAKRDELRTMLVDLLYYGAASQVYMEYKTDNLVTSALTEEQIAWGTSEAPTLTSVLSPNYATVENPEVRLVGASLNLKDAVRVKLVFSAENIEGLSFKAAIEGKEWIISSESFVNEGNGNYSMLFSGLHAGQMSESIYFTAMRNGEAVSNTARYSIESYAYQKQNDANTALADLVKTMMNYGNAAKAYANAQ